MLTRTRGLGDAATVNAYTAWVADVKALLHELYGDAWRLHGGPVVMPSNVPPSMQQYVGQPAAMFDNETYTALANGGYLDMSRPQVASNSGKAVFVLALPGVIAAAPPTMTTTQRIANAVFTTGDVAAEAAGLPSLAGVENFIKGLGKEVLVGVVVAVGVGIALKRMGRR